jgi:serine/threonine protein kinase
MTGDDETRAYARHAAAAPPPPTEAPPEQLVGTILAGRYEIKELLGVGAMGAVYLGQHLKIGRKDAIKVLRSSLAQDPDAIARFDRGARNVGAIRHPNVCTIYDFSDTGMGQQYLAMEFIAGESLKDLLDRESLLPLDRAVRINDQVAGALQAAHNAGIVHRDLKPANVMLSRGAGDEDVVKVVDFDLSKGTNNADRTEVTRLGSVVGTPEYMSPEQLCGDTLDGRSDVYTLALVFYRMAAGALPFKSETVQDIMASRLSDVPITPLAELAPAQTFPAGLQQVLDRALEQLPGERTQSASAFAAQVREVAGATRSRVPATISVSLPATMIIEASRRRPRNLSAMAAGVAALLMIGVGYWYKDTLFPTSGTPPAGASSDMTGGDSLHRQNAALADPPKVDGRVGGVPANKAPLDQSKEVTQTGGAVGGGSVSSAAGSTPPQPPPTSEAPITVAFATAFIARVENMLLSTIKDAAVLKALADSAPRMYDVPGLSDRQRSDAAMVAANVFLASGDLKSCFRWASKADQLTPGKDHITPILDACR